MEIWKDIKNYKGLYQVSNYGRVKRLKTIVNSSCRNGGKRITPEKILKQNIKRNGYLTVDLSKNGITKTISVHRLVALTFIPNEDTNKTQIDHINCNKKDNRVCNLEWVSDKENRERAKQNNLYNNPNKKQVRNKQLNLIFNGSYKAAEFINEKLFKNSKKVKTIAGRIRACCCGILKTAYGYTWQYM